MFGTKMFGTQIMFGTKFMFGTTHQLFLMHCTELKLCAEDKIGRAEHNFGAEPQRCRSYAFEYAPDNLRVLVHRTVRSEPFFK